MIKNIDAHLVYFNSNNLTKKTPLFQPSYYHVYFIFIYFQNADWVRQKLMGQGIQFGGHFLIKATPPVSRQFIEWLFRIGIVMVIRESKSILVTHPVTIYRVCHPPFLYTLYIRRKTKLFDGPSWIQYDLFRKNKLPGSNKVNLVKFMLRALYIHPTPIPN